MNICPKCRLLCAEVCSRCGKKRGLRPAEADEPVLLFVLTAMQAMLAEPILAESGIPYVRKGEIGGALSAQVGVMREIFHFYVSASDLDRSRALIEDTFGADSEIPKLLHEFDIQKD